MIPIFNFKRTYLLLLFSLVIFLLIVGGCGAPDESDQVAEPVEEEADDEEIPAEETTFTMEEIAQYDGKDGNPAYIVVDGIVYDVSNVGQWSSGSHFGFEAGSDVTEALQDVAPHGENMLNQAEVVGTIID